MGDPKLGALSTRLLTATWVQGKERRQGMRTGVVSPQPPHRTCPRSQEAVWSSESSGDSSGDVFTDGVHLKARVPLLGASCGKQLFSKQHEITPWYQRDYERSIH